MKAEEILTYFARWIETETGIVYEGQNLYQLQDRLDQLARLFKLQSSEDLWRKAQGGITGEFREKLVDTSTNNETSFFRDPKFYDCLKKSILPLVISQVEKFSDLQVWSAASSTGQEPYSLAMILFEIALARNQNPPKIFATDISTRALTKAMAGQYNELEINRGLTPEMRDRFFKRDEKNIWSLDARIKNMVHFENLNLKEQFSINKKFDLILCRNILIYQRLEAKMKIVKNLASQLRPNGFLLMGAGESLLGLSDSFHTSLIDGVAIYQHKQKILAAA